MLDTAYPSALPRRGVGVVGDDGEAGEAGEGVEAPGASPGVGKGFGVYVPPELAQAANNTVSDSAPMSLTMTPGLSADVSNCACAS